MKLPFSQLPELGPLTLVSGRPNSGRTFFLARAADHFLREGRRVAFISTEPAVNVWMAELVQAGHKELLSMHVSPLMRREQVGKLLDSGIHKDVVLIFDDFDRVAFQADGHAIGALALLARGAASQAAQRGGTVLLGRCGPREPNVKVPDHVDHWDLRGSRLIPVAGRSEGGLSTIHLVRER